MQGIELSTAAITAHNVGKPGGGEMQPRATPAAPLYPPLQPHAVATGAARPRPARPASAQGLNVRLVGQPRAFNPNELRGDPQHVAALAGRYKLIKVCGDGNCAFTAFAAGLLCTLTARLGDAAALQERLEVHAQSAEPDAGLQALLGVVRRMRTGGDARAERLTFFADAPSVRQLTAYLRAVADLPGPQWGEDTHLVRLAEHLGVGLRIEISDPPAWPSPGLDASQGERVVRPLSGAFRHRAGRIACYEFNLDAPLRVSLLHTPGHYDALLRRKAVAAA